MFTKRFSRALVVMTTASLVLAATTFADTVSNDLDADVDATLETMNLTVGGSDVVAFILGPTNNDAKNGCNLGGPDSELRLGISSSDSSVASLSASEVTLSACGTQSSDITVTGASAGMADISLTFIGVTTNSGAASASDYNLLPGTFTVIVAAPVPTDTTAPVIAPSVLGTLGDNGWYTSDVTVSWTVVDGESAIASSTGCGPTTISSDTTGTTLTCSATSAGGTSSQSVTIKRDATAPTIAGSASPAANGNGWNNSAVDVTFSCADATAGVASCGPNATLSTEGANQSASGTAKDNAGNTASTTVSDIDIDLTDPTVSLIGGPTDGGSYYFGFVPAVPTCSASDALSGVDGSCAVTGYGTSVGSHTVSASATDLAGNSGTDSATYTVLAWTPSGFYSPVDMGTVWNTIKGGQTVPLKFELFAGATELKDPSYVDTFKQREISCSSFGDTSVSDAVEITSTGGTTLRFDASGDQFVQNWQTPKGAGKCYVATVSFDDGSFISAYFKTK